MRILLLALLTLAYGGEQAGIYAKPKPVARAPKLGDKAKSSKDPSFQELLKTIQSKAYQKQANERLKAMGSKLKFSQLVAKWHKDHPKITSTQLALNLAGLEVKAPSVLAAASPNLCDRITPYAQAMANADQSNAHLGIEGRWAGMHQYEEIVQGGYPLYGGKDHSILAAARDCFHTPDRTIQVGNVRTTYKETGWKTSDKHWKAVMGEFKSFCYDMRMSRTGAYYCVGAFSTKD